MAPEQPIPPCPQCGFKDGDHSYDCPVYKDWKDRATPRYSTPIRIPRGR